MKRYSKQAILLTLFALALSLMGTGQASASSSQTSASSTFFELRNVMNHKCLEILAFNPNNGAAAGMWDCWGGAIQQWYWDGSQIRSRFNNKCLEILAFNPDNGARVGMWDCWGGANQQWYTRDV